MYFVHSYAVIPDDDKYMLSTTRYDGVEFCSVVMSGNVFGCQFHPEKSAAQGLKIIKNFSRICEETTC